MSPPSSDQQEQWARIAARRRTLRYRVVASSYEYGRIAKRVLFNNAFFIPELLGIGLAAILVTLTERCC